MSTSLWHARRARLELPVLPASTTTDVCIIGAGVVGLTTAYMLAREGRSVVVLDDGPFLAGETARTTAHLTTALDRGYAAIERYHGESGARLAAESHAMAIDRIESIVESEGIACDFERVDGFLFCRGDDPEPLAQEAWAARRAGVAGVEWAKTPLASLADCAFVRFPRQAQLHPLAYLEHLVHAIQREGGQIYAHTRVHGIEDGTPARVRAARDLVVTANAVVEATNVPIARTLSVHVKQAAYRTYVVAGTVPSGSVPRALYWDTATPFHYVRVVGGHAGADDLLVIGGEDHKTGCDDGEAPARYQDLEIWARDRFPMLERITHQWSGQVIESMDGLGFIGRIEQDPNVFVVTGDSGNGLTHATIAGMLLTDLLAGRDNPWAPLYDPNRVRVRAFGALVKENLGVAAQMTRWVTPGEVSDRAEIAPGCGAVVRDGASKAAVYRDLSGSLFECSAVCPHLKCIVGWNAAEQSWDCPCHGSRFDPYGRVLHGPALSDLSPRPTVLATGEPEQEGVS